MQQPGIRMFLSTVEQRKEESLIVVHPAGRAASASEVQPKKA
jgi:hypothetical protein